MPKLTSRRRVALLSPDLGLDYSRCLNKEQPTGSGTIWTGSSAIWQQPEGPSWKTRRIRVTVSVMTRKRVGRESDQRTCETQTQQTSAGVNLLCTVGAGTSRQNVSEYLCGRTQFKMIGASVLQCAMPHIRLYDQWTPWVVNVSYRVSWPVKDDW